MERPRSNTVKGAVTALAEWQTTRKRCFGVVCTGMLTDSPLYGNAGVYREGDYMYDGEFFEDVITGYGTFRYASGSTYSGEWKTGKYHGKVSMDLPATLCTRGHLRCA